MDKFIFTDKGLEYAAKTATGSALVFTRGKFGDGTTNSAEKLTDLVHTLGELQISKKTISGNQVTIETQFTNALDSDSTLPAFHLKEIGLFAKLQSTNGKDDKNYPETLVCYARAAGDDAGDYIPATPTEFIINWPFSVSNTDNIKITVGLQAFALQLDLDNETAARKTHEGNVASITQLGHIKLYNRSGVNASGLVVSDDGTVVVNVDNNHGLYRSGAGQITTAAASEAEIDAKADGYKVIVPSNLDYAAAQAAPTYSDAATLTTLTSGEKLSVALGKIKKAITDFIAHLSNTSNPHKVTATNVGLGNVTNESKTTMFSSPTFTGTPKAPTASSSTNSTQIATTAFVQKLCSALEQKITAMGKMIIAETWSDIASFTLTTEKMDSDDGEFTGYTFISGEASTIWGSRVPVQAGSLGKESWGQLSRSILRGYAQIVDGTIQVFIDNDEREEEDTLKSVTLGASYKVV